MNLSCHHLKILHKIKKKTNYILIEVTRHRECINADIVESLLIIKDVQETVELEHPVQEVRKCFRV